MTQSLFVQLHYLTAYPGSLLNRDDAGLAKRIPFGGMSRIRVSSQCLKRHWRTAAGEHGLKALGVPMSVRSRMIFEKLIARPLIAEGLPEDTVRAVLLALQSQLLGESEKSKKRKEGGKDEGEDLMTSQVITLGRPEIEFIINVAREIARGSSKDEAKNKVEAYLKDRNHAKNLEALKKVSSAGLDAALFGRMVTSDILARGDAAIHVAHAFTVHAEETETDYFSAVDDLVAEAGELGSGHINETELTSGLFYGYVVVDVPQLIMNFEGVERHTWTTADRSLAARVVESLIHLVATVSPGAKLGSTAPYSYAHLVMAETGAQQPRTLANAFLNPVDPRAPGGVFEASIRALASHLKAYDVMYGHSERRCVASLSDASGIPADRVDSLAILASAVAAQVRGD